MLKSVSIPGRIIALFLLACLLLLPSVSPALAASDDKPQKSDNQGQNQSQNQNQTKNSKCQRKALSQSQSKDWSQGISKTSMIIANERFDSAN